MDNYIAYKHANNNWNMKRYHFHDQYEILLSLSGDAEIFVTDRCYPLRYGSLILLPQAVLHRSVAAQQEYNRYVIRFTHKYAQTLSTPVIRRTNSDEVKLPSAFSSSSSE